jgi:sugar lactone lactonase YvrE
MVRQDLTVALILAASAFIAVPARADFHYATRYDGTVTQVDTTTHAATTFVSGLTGGAGGLAFDSSGNLYVTNYGDNSIEKFTPGGVGTVFASGLNNPAGLAFDSSGNLFVAEYVGNNDGMIEKFTPGGVGSVFTSGLNGPVGLAFDGAGNLFVSSDSGDQSIMRFSPDGVGSVFASATPYYPTGLAFDSSGNLYAAHDGDGMIDQFSPDGSRTTFSTSASDTISFIAIRPAAVPEPSSLVLSVMGVSSLIGGGLLRRFSVPMRLTGQ